MKKLLSFLLIIMLLFSLFGCKQPEREETATADKAVEQAQQETSAQPSKPVTVQPVEQQAKPQTPTQEQPTVQEPEKKKAQAKPGDDETEEPAPETPEFTGTPVEFKGWTVDDTGSRDYTQFYEAYETNEQGYAAIRIENTQQLEYFIGQAAVMFAYHDETAEELLKFYNEKLAHFDATFFETKVLYLLPLSAGSGSYNYALEGVTAEEGRLNFWINYIGPKSMQGGTCDMRYFLLAAELSKEEIADLNGYQFQIYAT